MAHGKAGWLEGFGGGAQQKAGAQALTLGGVLGMGVLEEGCVLDVGEQQQPHLGQEGFFLGVFRDWT